MKSKRIIIENTEYSILLYCLLKKKWQEDTFILSDLFRESFLKTLKEKVKEIFIFEPTSIKKYILRYYFGILKLYLYLIKKSFRKNVEIYGNDSLVYSRFINKGYILLEDGSINYKIIKSRKNYLKEIMKLKNPFYSPYGYSKKIKKIYLTGLAQIPEEIKNKVEIIDLKKLWKLKTREEQQEILEIFGFNNNLIKELKEKNIILFTQPLSEDGILNEQEKIELYSKIILKYPKEKLIIKTHPREKTNYSKIFNEIYILEQNFPAEIFKLLEISFKKGVTLFSTAVLTNNCKEIDFYGTEVHPKLLKKFGSMDHIMKRNKFL